MTTTARRTLRFERGGPAPDVVLQQLRDAPPTQLAAVEAHWHVDRVDGAHELQVQAGTATLSARVVDQCLELHGESPSMTVADRTRLVALVDALTDVMADPERHTVRAASGELAFAGDATVERRAQELFDNAVLSIDRGQALRLVVQSIDLTTLAGDDTPGRIRALCARALQPDPTDVTLGPCAAICVYPSLVSTAVEVLDGTDVAVASVAGAFPSGLSSLEVRLTDIAEAVCAGAAEIDVVLNRSAFLAGDDARVLSDLRAMRDQIGPRVMKVIVETSELETPTAIRKAASLAIQAGADWIKTSTGKTGFGATPAAVLTMAEAIAEVSRPVGLKVSGGVRTPLDALGYLAILESVLGEAVLDPQRVRFGASSLLDSVVVDLIQSS